MKNRVIAVLGVVLAALVFCAGLWMFMEKKKGNSMQTKLIPRKVLFGNPDKANVKLSHDGKYISYLADRDGVLNIYVADIDDIQSATPITNDKHRGVRSYFWAYDNKNIIYLQDDNGDENWHVHLVDIATQEARDLTPFKGSLAYISAVSRKFPNEIMISLNKRDPKYFDIYRLDITTGELKLVYENKLNFGSIDIDDNYTLRFASKPTVEGGEELLKFDESLSAEPFLSISPEDSHSTGIMGFDKTAETIYLQDSRGRDTSALVTLNLNTNEQKVIYHNDKADLSGVIIHPIEKNIQAVAYNYERVKWTIFDDAIKSDFEYLNSLHDGEVSIVSRTTNDEKWIIAYQESDKPLYYYLYDRSLKKAEFLFSNRKDLEDYELAPMHPVIIKTRDGLEMVSYLTLPLSALRNKHDLTPKQPVPLILDVHGGPEARDSWGFSATDQWFANRGYAVLSVNYRGSTGFGKKFIELGNGQWGAKMHEDLLDAVDFAIAQKITTKDKVAIFGGSYGGYAALAGLAFTPDVFACGVDIVGPSNLITLMNSVPPYWETYRHALIRKIGGDPSTEEGRKFLESRSPLTFHEQIKKPLLIGQGANDPRVNRAESDQIVKAMKSKKIPVTYILYSDEGHGFARPENKMSFFAVTEQFLARCFSNKNFEPVGDAFQGSSIEILEGKDLIPTE